MQVPVVFCADGHYGQYLPAAVQSIIENSSPAHEYHIIIFDCGIKPHDLEILRRQIASHKHFFLEIKDISAALAEHKKAFIVGEKQHLSPATYGRLLIPHLCENYEKLIYADIDMVFNRDLSELMQIDLGENYIGGVIDSNIEAERYERRGIKTYIEQVLGMKPEQYYVNAGLLLLNLKAWREQKLGEKAIALLKLRSFKRHDQDAINSVTCGHIVYIPQYWNCVYPLGKNRNACENKAADKSGKSKNVFPEALAEALRQKQQALQNSAAVFHFVGAIKPWYDMADDKALLWWRYADKTESADNLMAQALHKQSMLNMQTGIVRYSIFGLPLLKVKISACKKKYFFCGILFGKQSVNIRTEDTFFAVAGLPIMRRRVTNAPL